nr:MAG TPA: hypothetical protein [Bacteriophage sp.]
MAGFQQAANAITGSFGTVAGRVGLYSELVGKNQKLIGELKTANKSLEESNEKITGLNEELGEKNKLIKQQYNNLKAAQEASLEQSQLTGNLAERLYSNVRARASRDIMLDVVYGEKPTAGPTRNFAKEQLKQERKEGGR